MKQPLVMNRQEKMGFFADLCVHLLGGLIAEALFGCGETAAVSDIPDAVRRRAVAQ